MLDFVNIKVPIKLHLPPTYSSRLQVGVLQYTHHLLLKYSSELDGIPVAINKISIVDPCAVIKYDNPYFHLSIIADLTLWRISTPDQLVCGEINKISGDHVALIVFGTVNATIPATSLRTGFFYETFSKAWIKNNGDCDPNNDPMLTDNLQATKQAHQLEIGQKLFFFIDYINFISDQQVSIIGRLS